MKTTLTNQVTETSSEAHFAVSSDFTVLSSGVRADALVLDALLTVDPHHALVEKLAYGLLNQQVQGRWDTTQENACVLMALAHYFDRFEKTSPDFVARLWVGDAFAGEQAFRGRSRKCFRVHIPMAKLLGEGRAEEPSADASSPQSLTLGRQGRGRLYYRLAMKSAPRHLRGGSHRPRVPGRASLRGRGQAR